MRVSYLNLNQQHLLDEKQQRNGDAPQDQRTALGFGWGHFPCFKTETLFQQKQKFPNTKTRHNFVAHKEIPKRIIKKRNKQTKGWPEKLRNIPKQEGRVTIELLLWTWLLCCLEALHIFHQTSANQNQSV